VLDPNCFVVQLFNRQIANGGPVTITHPESVRYFMNTKEACQLILEAAAMGDGGRSSYSIWVSLLKLLIWLEI
jgi:FlaA1/EpsC-like NDP-sugar epimerase